MQLINLNRGDKFKFVDAAIPLKFRGNSVSEPITYANVYIYWTVCEGTCPQLLKVGQALDDQNGRIYASSTYNREIIKL